MKRGAYSQALIIQNDVLVVYAYMNKGWGYIALKVTKKSRSYPMI